MCKIFALAMYISCCLCSFHSRWFPNANPVCSAIWAYVYIGNVPKTYPLPKELAFLRPCSIIRRGSGGGAVGCPLSWGPLGGGGGGYSLNDIYACRLYEIEIELKKPCPCIMPESLSS